LGGCHPDGPHLKLKYLLDLERLQRRCAEEIFHVRSPGSAAAIAIHVSGESGVSWSCGGSESRQHFCDFPDIADISIKQAASRDGGPVENRLVTEVEFPTLREARSFVALLDGYYRLTADAQHYFCREVAPPRLLEDLENQCHGPIRWVPAPPGHPRAGGGAGREGTEPPLGTPGWAQGIRRDGDGHLWLSGVARRFCSLRELLGTYGRRGLQAEGAQMRLEVACPPRPKALLVRSGVPCPPGSPPAPRRRSLHQMMFHKIDPQSLTRGESLGQGSFTQIYKGVKRDEDEEDGPRQTPVVLKVMDSSHRNCLESFLEAASTMSQLSHKHLVLLHGVSLGKDSECPAGPPGRPPTPLWAPPDPPGGPAGVMVQEHVRHGPLDLYLRKHRGAVTTGWKLTVAKQLAYALNYL
ncbi:JAK3 kinase, partial [Dryoscopus gambensis]|nr:JAK3 kinase [Dryoscopus gambensis]